MNSLHVFGIGIDIEDIDRFANMDRIKDERFLKKIFTDRELEYCFSQAEPAQHLTVRFCAKEAVIKALECTKIRIVDLAEIEINHTSYGSPEVVLHRESDTKLTVKVSLSHSGALAIAIALIIQV